MSKLLALQIQRNDNLQLNRQKH